MIAGAWRCRRSPQMYSAKSWCVSVRLTSLRAARSKVTREEALLPGESSGVGFLEDVGQPPRPVVGLENSPHIGVCR